ncbi:MAG: YdcF family protein [Elusimicrobia bacterium]|nr:YdcF family protein [Elusimicrobiota bacterium]
MTLRNLIPVLLSPAFLVALGLAAIAALLMLRPKSKLVKGVSISVFLLYYFFSTWPLANLLLSALEGKYPAASPGDFAQTRLIVVLAGNATMRGGLRARSELNEASWKRLWRGIELYDELKGKAPVFFVGESDDPLRRAPGGASLVWQAASRWQISPRHFWIDHTPGNTYTSALVVQGVLAEKFPGEKNPKIALVTSAWHMPRAAGVFKKAGIEFIAEPCDWRSVSLQLNAWAWLPNFDALSTSTLALREWLGIAAYKIRDHS